MIVELALVWALPSRMVTIGPRDPASQAWLVQHETALSVPLGRVRREFVNAPFNERAAVLAAAMLQALAEAQDQDRERHGYARAAAGYRVRAGRYVDRVVVREQEFEEYGT